MNGFEQIRASLARIIAPKTTRRFEAAVGRPWSAGPAFGRMAAETLAAAAPLRHRARDAYANNPHARAAVEAWVTALVGTGARATSKHSEEEVRTQISAAIDHWSDAADIDGVTDWYGLQANLARAMVIDGEALLMLIDTPDGLRLRQLPAEMLADEETRELNNGGRITGGVEFDEHGRRTAYWIRPDMPSAAWASWAPPRRVSADDIIHLFRPLGAGQVRGVSWLAPVLLKLGDIDQLSDALLMGFKISAMHVGFVEDATDFGGGVPYSGDSAGGVITEDMEPGTLKVLPFGKKVTFNAPQQAQQAPEFLGAELRAVAVGVGVPAHLVSGDLSKANYSSLRADLVAFRQRYEQIQYGTLAPQLMRPVYSRAITSLILTGVLDATGFEQHPRAWSAAEFLFPVAPWVDPAKDVAAYRDLIDAGLMSRRQAVAERGWSIEQLDIEIANDRARETSLGLSFVPTQPSKSEEETSIGQG